MALDATKRQQDALMAYRTRKPEEIGMEPARAWAEMPTVRAWSLRRTDPATGEDYDVPRLAGALDSGEIVWTFVTRLVLRRALRAMGLNPDKLPPGLGGGSV